MLMRSFLVFVLFLSLSPRESRAQAPQTMRQLAATWIADLNRHDTNALALLYLDTAKLFSPNWEGARIGPDGARTVYSRYFTGTPDLTHEMTNLIVTDQAIVIEYTSHGTFTHPEPGTPEYMRGKAYTLQTCTRLDIQNGRIARQVNYFDQVAFLRQVGFFDQK